MITDKVVLFGFATVIEDKAPMAEKILKDFIQTNAKEEGCEKALIYQDSKNSLTFMVFEIYKNHKAWLTHIQQGQVTEFSEVSKEYFSSVSFDTYTQYLDTTSPTSTESIYASGKFAVIGRGTALPEQMLPARDSVLAFTTANKQHERCVSSSLYINKKNVNEFLAYEVWEDQSSWMKNLQSQQFTDFSDNSNNLFSNLKLTTYNLIYF